MNDQLICAQSQYFKKEVDWSQYDLYDDGAELPKLMAQLFYSSGNEELNVLYQLAKDETATIEVFDITGRKVLEDNLLANHSMFQKAWKPVNGIYVYKIKGVNGFNVSGKFIAQ